MTNSLFRGSFACLVAQARFQDKPTMCILCASSLLDPINHSNAYDCAPHGLAACPGHTFTCAVPKTRTGTGTKRSEKFGTGRDAPFSFRGSVLQSAAVSHKTTQLSITRPSPECRRVSVPQPCCLPYHLVHFPW
jgi:hypothetical protein